MLKQCVTRGCICIGNERLDRIEVLDEARRVGLTPPRASLHALRPMAAPSITSLLSAVRGDNPSIAPCVPETKATIPADALRVLHRLDRARYQNLAPASRSASAAYVLSCVSAS